MFGKKRTVKPNPSFAVVRAERHDDRISYTIDMEYNSNIAIRNAEALAGDSYGTVAVAVIDWTGCSRWNQGKRIAYFGEIL